MDCSSSRTLLKANLEVALDVGFTNKIHQSELIPGCIDPVHNIGGNRDVPGDIGGQERTALAVIVCLDVVGIRHVVLVGATDLFKSHFSFLLCWNSFCYFAFAIGNGFSDFDLLRFFSLAVLHLFVDGLYLGFKCIKVRFRRIYLFGYCGTSLQKLIDGHIFEIHHFTSDKILILCFCLSIALFSAFALSSDAFALSSASASPRASRDVCE